MTLRIHIIVDFMLISCFISLQLTPDGKKVGAAHSQSSSHNENNGVNKSKSAGNTTNEDDFFEMLTKSQSKRMDDQRCSLKVIGHSKSQMGREPSRKPLVQQNSLPAMPSAHPSATKENR